MRMLLANRLFLLFFFLLPWQTVWIFQRALIAGNASQYGSFSLYATEILLLIVFFLRGRPQLDPSLRFVGQASYFVMAAAFFSLAFTRFFPIALSHVLHLLFAMFLFLTICDTRTDVRKIVSAFLCGLILPALLGLFQIFAGFSPASKWLGLSFQGAQILGTAVVETASGRMLRAYGTFAHPNIFGGYLAVGILFFAWWIRFVKTRWIKYASFGIIGLLSATVVMTFSRSAWLALVIGLIVLTSLMYHRKQRISKELMSFVLVGCATVLVMAGLFYAPIFSRVQTTNRIEKISIEERTSQYRSVPDVFRRSPVFGIGPGAYPFALAKLFPGGEAWSYQPIHNTWLLILCELGGVGFAALLYFLVRIDQVSSRVSKQPGGMFGLSLGIVLIVLAFFDHYPWSFWSGLALSAIVLGVIVKWALDPP
ncbi:MAG: O-antigen ligase family protein [Patescibacteria group bacterium]|mgnify:CR=1 FL=1